MAMQGGSLRWCRQAATVVAVAVAVTLPVLVGVPAGASQPPMPPPDRTRVVVLDVSALAHSMAKLPSPLPMISTDPQSRGCIDVPAKQATFTPFPGIDITLTGTRANLCQGRAGDGAVWVLSWSGRSPVLDEMGGYSDSGSFSLLADDPNGTWRAAVGSIDIRVDGRYEQFSLNPLAGAFEGDATHEWRGYYLRNGNGLPLLEAVAVPSTTTSTTADAPPAVGPAEATAAVPVGGAATFTG